MYILVVDVVNHLGWLVFMPIIFIVVWQMSLPFVCGRCLTTYTTLELMLLHTVLSMLTDVFVNYIEDICLADVIAIYMIVADVIATKADVVA